MISDDMIKVLCLAPDLSRTENLAKNLTGATNAGDCCIGNSIYALIRDVDNYDCEIIEVNSAEELSELKSYFLNSSGVFVISDKDYSEDIGIDLKWINKKTSIDSLRKIIKDSIKSLKKLLAETFDKLAKNGLINYESLDNFVKLVGENLTEDEINLCLDSLEKRKDNITYPEFERWWRKKRENSSIFKRLVYLAMMNSKLVDDIGLRHELSEFRQKEINMTKSYIKLFSQEMNTYSSRIQIHVIKSKDKFKLLRANRIHIEPAKNFLEIHIDFDNQCDINHAVEWLKNTYDDLINRLKGVFGVLADVYQHFFTVGFIKAASDNRVSVVISDRLDSNAMMEEYLVYATDLSNIIPKDKDIKIDIRSGRLINSMFGLKLFDVFKHFSIECSLNLLRASSKMLIKRFDFYKHIKSIVDLIINHKNLDLKLQTTIENLLDKEYNYDLSMLSSYLEHRNHNEVVDHIKSVKIHLSVSDLYSIIEIEGFK
jgi:hypothetical protein